MFLGISRFWCERFWCRLNTHGPVYIKLKNLPIFLHSEWRFIKPHPCCCIICPQGVAWLNNSFITLKLRIYCCSCNVGIGELLIDISSMPLSQSPSIISNKQPSKGPTEKRLFTGNCCLLFTQCINLAAIVIIIMYKMWCKVGLKLASGSPAVTVLLSFYVFI